MPLINIAHNVTKLLNLTFNNNAKNNKLEGLFKC